VLLTALLAWLAAPAALLAGQPTPAGRLDIAVYAFPPGLGNPHTQTNLPAIFLWPAILEPLTVIAEDGTVAPALGLSWQRVDELTWRFELRPGVRFSNGEAFDAQAAAATLEFLRSPAAAGMMVAGEVAHIARTRVHAPLVLDVITHGPDPLLPRSLAVVRMVPPQYWREVGPAGFARLPVGTGPFRVRSWGATRIELEAWQGSWRTPRVQALVFHELPEAPSRVQAIRAGAVDIAVQLGPDDEPALRAAGARLVSRPTGSVLGLSFLLTRPGPLQDLRVRRALNLAVDRRQIVLHLLGARTEVASQHASRHAFGHHPSLSPYAYDPEAARALLAEAGYPEGFRLTAEVAIGVGANDAAVYQQVAAELSRIGVELDLRSIPIQLLVSRLFTGDWRGEAFGMGYDAAPHLDGWRPFRQHSCLWVRPWFCDPALTGLVEAVSASGDLQARTEAMHRLLEAYHAAMPSLPLYEVVGFDAVGPRVRNYRNVFGVINFHELDLLER
jgi:peptide/nickel transport system substrate-binding protein